MQSEKARALAQQIADTYNSEGDRPMPQSDIAKLRETAAEGAEAYRYLSADLSNYWLQIVGGICTRAPELHQESTGWLRAARVRLERSFFGWHPEYARLEAHITESVTPDLYLEMVLHERLRIALLQLISLLLDERGSRGSQ
jgi:hypothetical protein